MFNCFDLLVVCFLVFVWVDFICLFDAGASVDCFVGLFGGLIFPGAVA